MVVLKGSAVPILFADEQWTLVDTDLELHHALGGADC
jgi:hypothetical protein